ncbi:MAG: Increased rDNA silencing protein [Heterodermia speciosa]|uniref:Increased rDNA silencing protein n=1 Tax=Heterodermia speciosa TaxID=116794 RepID=A0A8H3PEE9_9LECA|nr:MAG: Increased rDNA silencing protein [Heterodermia speciosa]
MTSRTAFTDNLHPADGVARSSHALRGASLAFSSPLANVERSLSQHKDTNGALAAASALGSRTTPTRSATDRQQGPSRLRRSHGTITENRIDGGRRTDMQQQSHRGFSSSLDSHDADKVLYTDDTKREQSPSYIAAVMAATKSTPVHDQSLDSMMRLDSCRPSPLHRHSDQPISHTPSISSIRHAADDTPIAPTNTLVQLYESIQTPDASTPKANQRNDDPLIVRPTPMRPPATMQPSIPETYSYGKLQEKAKNRGNSTPTSVAYSSIGAAAAAVKLAKPVAPAMKSPRTREAPISKTIPSHMPAKRRALPKLQQRQEARKAESPSPSSSSSYVSAVDKLTSPGNERLDLRLHDSSNKFDTEFKSADLQQTNLQNVLPATFLPHKQAPPRPVYNKSSRSFDGPVYRSAPGRLCPPTLSSASLVPQLTANSLANAMVASSLASSRAPSPTKPHLPPARRHGKAHSIFRRSQSTEEISRTPSPAKQMRQTLRTAKKGEEEEELYKARRTHFMKKHPNKHHEGDRKRWRDSVSEAERKRYEGVWAANKNLLHPPEATATSQNPVLDIVVRDIWRRSRLPDDVLEEIWNLVDTARGGALGKNEFVVGMWLIDQRLKGRKLPARVSESVWGSVRMLSGIKFPKHRK